MCGPEYFNSGLGLCHKNNVTIAQVSRFFPFLFKVVFFNSCCLNSSKRIRHKWQPIEMSWTIYIRNSLSLSSQCDLREMLEFGVNINGMLNCKVVSCYQQSLSQTTITELYLVQNDLFHVVSYTDYSLDFCFHPSLSSSDIMEDLEHSTVAGIETDFMGCVICSPSSIFSAL